jgi:putative redox protein
MTSMHGKYLGEKRVEIIHDDSGAKITTSAPKDNQGDGLQFSPTDLVAAALGGCIITTLAIVAERNNISVAGAHFTVEKQMNQSPRRIGRLPVVVHLPAGLSAEQRTRVEAAAKACPVHHSLHPEIEAVIDFIYDVG